MVRATKKKLIQSDHAVPTVLSLLKPHFDQTLWAFHNPDVAVENAPAEGFEPDRAINGFRPLKPMRRRAINHLKKRIQMLLSVKYHLKNSESVSEINSNKVIISKVLFLFLTFIFF